MFKTNQMLTMIMLIIVLKIMTKITVPMKIFKMHLVIIVFQVMVPKIIIKIVFIIFIHLVLITTKNIQIFLVSLFVYLQINTLLRILIPTGLDPSLLGDRRVWFLSTKNGVTLYILLFLLCALYCWYKSKSGNQVLRLFSVFLICILDSIPLHSATLMLSLLSTFCVIFIGLTFKSRYRKLVHIVCFWLLLFSYVYYLYVLEILVELV